MDKIRSYFHKIWHQPATRRVLRIPPANQTDTGLCAWFLGSCLVMLQSELLGSVALCAIAVCTIIICLCRFRKALSCIALLLCGILYTNINFLNHKSALLPVAYEGQSIVVRGQITGLPRQDPNRVRFEFLVSAVPEDLPTEQSLQGIVGEKLLLNCYRCKLALEPDQLWQFTLRLKRPRGFASWGAFDYEKYLFRHRVVATGYVRLQEANQLLKRNNAGIHSWRYMLRESVFSSAAPDRSGAGIFNALMLGDRSLLSAEARQVFQVTGISHLMAISGLHIGLVFILSCLLMRYLLWPFAELFNHVARQQLVLLPALLFAGGYAALAGFAISTQRAMLMLSVYVLCRLFARDLSLLRVLILAIAVLVLIDPFSILDVGFWLSCFAVLLIAVANLRFSGLKLWQLQPWLWLGMLPVSAFFFGQVSLISPLVNLIAVPLFCLLLVPAVLLTLALFLLGFQNLAQFCLANLTAVFDQVFIVLQWISLQPMAYVYPQSLHLWQALLLISILFLGLYRWRLLPVFVLVATVWLWPRPSSMASDAYEVTLLDVGQGLAMVVRAEGYVLVYDTGPAFSTGFTTAQAVLLPYLRAHGIRSIDHLVISHADSDHIGGLDTVLAEMPVDKISTSRMDKMPVAQKPLSSACVAGQSWQIGQLRFQFVSPDSATPAGSNNQSCVLKIDNGELQTLITGDIERPVERHLIATAASEIAADFMLVPHQGSKTSSSERFIDAVKPRLALLAAGYRNHYGHPHDKVVTRYNNRRIRLLSTVDSGSITLKIKGERWEVQQFRILNARVWRS